MISELSHGAQQECKTVFQEHKNNLWLNHHSPLSLCIPDKRHLSFLCTSSLFNAARDQTWVYFKLLRIRIPLSVVLPVREVIVDLEGASGRDHSTGQLQGAILSPEELKTQVTICKPGP